MIVRLSVLLPQIVKSCPTLNITIGISVTSSFYLVKKNVLFGWHIRQNWHSFMLVLFRIAGSVSTLTLISLCIVDRHIFIFCSCHDQLNFFFFFWWNWVLYFLWMYEELASCRRCQISKCNWFLGLRKAV